MTTLLAFLFALGLLVFIHELGHYLAARACDVKVLRFSIGFGKPFVSFAVGPDRTQWTIAPLPLGGFVRMLDEREDPSAQIPAADLPRAFNRQSLARRAFIVSAGPAANFLLAMVLYAALGMAGTEEPVAVMAAPPAASAAQAAGLQRGDRIVAVDGEPVRSFVEVRTRLIDPVVARATARLTVQRAGQTLDVPVRTDGLGAGELERDFVRTLGLDLDVGAVLINSVMPDSAAARAGLQAGDEVIAANGSPIRRASDLINQVRDAAGKEILLEIRRGAVEQQVPVTPVAQASDRPEDQGRSVGRIGASLQNKVEMVKVVHGPFEAIGEGVRKTWEMSWFSLRMLGKMLVGELSWRNLSGPVAIADYAGQSARIGVWAYVSFLALISVSLGVLNLLPVPVLDGGHLVYYGLEAIKGRPLSERFMQITQRAGLAAVVGLMALALFNDLSRLFGS